MDKVVKSTSTKMLEEDNIARMASTGILIPMLKNKWRIDKVSTLNENETDIFTLQAISLKYKFKAPSGSQFGLVIKERHHLFIELEECINGTIASIVDKLMCEPFDLSYVNLDGDISSLKTTTFKNCTGVGYDYDLNYANSETCKFPLKFTCEEIIYS